MTGKWGNVAMLRPVEAARIDPVRFLALRRELGDAGAARMLARTLVEMDAAVVRMEALRSARTDAEFCREGRTLSRRAAGVGLSRIAGVATEVARLHGTRNEQAAAAVWSRLLRLTASALGDAGLDRRERR